jgi:hypothetical protein
VRESIFDAQGLDGDVQVRPGEPVEHMIAEFHGVGEIIFFGGCVLWTWSLVLGLWFGLLLLPSTKTHVVDNVSDTLIESRY